jgi:hypothetical protein
VLRAPAVPAFVTSSRGTVDDVGMDAQALRPRRVDLEVVSPELALVDPRLREAARLSLPDVVLDAPLARREVARAAPVQAARRMPQELVEAPRRHASSRTLVGVAAVTMLTLLLLDVRVEVGERPASATQPKAEDVPSSAAPPSAKPKPAPQPKPKPAPQPKPKPAPQSTPKPKPKQNPTDRVKARPVDRRFAWAPVERATGYHVEFFRGQTRVFARDTSRPELTVPGRWIYQGTARSFRPGDYKWYVWPIVSGRRESRAAVQTTVSVPRG